jgi:hypothetical protein
MAANPVRHPAADEEPSYLVSVSDLMVGMLFIFIIILMAFALNFRIAQEDAARVQGQLVRDRDVVDAEKDRLASERDRLAANAINWPPSGIGWPSSATPSGR